MSEAVTETPDQVMDLSTSRQFVSWMTEHDLSLGFSTYQSGKVFLLGHNDQHELAVFERTFERPMGMWCDGQTLLLASLYQIYRFQNILPEGELSDGYDRLFVPKLSYYTADVDVHDIGLNPETNLPVFANTLFSCISESSITHSFKPIWQPEFIKELAAEDRCHLNGLAFDPETKQPKYVTAVSASNIADGWRDHRMGGGIVIDVETNEVVCRGLSMPHSPRIHQGKLWIANSGTGEFGSVNLETGEFEPLVFCPGYIRGVAFHGDFAVVGLSKSRGNKTFEGLAIDERLNKEDISPRCGIYVVDLKNGTTPHWLHASGVVTELYDVVALPGVKRPSLIGFRNDQIRRVISIEEG